MYLFTLFFRIKISTKNRHANILKTVAPKKNCAPASGFIRCPISMVITTKNVSTDKKKNMSQKCGVIK